MAPPSTLSVLEGFTPAVRLGLPPQTELCTTALCSLYSPTDLHEAAHLHTAMSSWENALGGHSRDSSPALQIHCVLLLASEKRRAADENGQTRMMPYRASA